MSFEKLLKRCGRIFGKVHQANLDWALDLPCWHFICSLSTSVLLLHVAMDCVYSSLQGLDLIGSKPSLPLLLCSSMAVAFISLPYPLLFDHLLASSWTWFAISLATIATSLRALLRHRLTINPHPLSALPPIPDTPLLLSSLAHVPYPPLASTSRESFQRRARSKSTSCLEKLHRNKEGLFRSSVEFLSSVLDAELTPSLKKISSASKFFLVDSSCQKTQQKPWHCASPTATNIRRSKVHNLPEIMLDADDRLGPRSGLGIVSETLVQDNEDSCSACFKEDEPDTHEDLLHWFPSWANSLCAPLHIELPLPSLSTYSEDEDCDNSAAAEATPFFERQFGWDKLLESRFGYPWTSPALCNRFADKSSDVVKTWPGRQKELLKALEVGSLALDMCARKGVACTGNANGEISLWDFGCKAYSKASMSSFPQPVVAMSINPDQGAAMVGSSKGLGIWDPRSSICMPLGCGSAVSANSITISDLKSRGNGLCIAHTDSILSMYDLRMPRSKALYRHRRSFANRAVALPDSDDEADADLLEKLTCDDDDDFWDEFSEVFTGNGSELQTGDSLLSRFASFMRVLSTPV